jgi:hypothetical protein
MLEPFAISSWAPGTLPQNKKPQSLKARDLHNTLVLAPLLSLAESLNSKISWNLLD